jgi:two-component system phosphate regulon response regulator PhoB
VAVIVIVDDDPDLLQLIQLTLECAEHEVVPAADGFAALEQIRLRQPDLVVTDEMMPGMTGTELAERLRAEETTADVPIILLTAASVVSRDLGLVDRWLAKPFRPRYLLSHTDALLRRGGRGGRRAA